jgi:hypothetical protein
MADLDARADATVTEGRDASGRKVYTCGTLKYTAFGLCSLFFWLLWGDFVWVMLNSAIPGILPLKLNQMGASDTQMSLLTKVLSSTIAFLLNPIVSTWSDRTRSRLGRRIPWLLWSTPLVGLAMIGIGCMEDITQFMMGDAQQTVFFGVHVGRAAMSLIVFGVLWVGFGLVDIFNDSVYYYLFNDVVPPQFLARFLSLFRMVGTVGGILYNLFLFEHALTSFRAMWVWGGIGYTVGYLLMCFMVKEGQYPPPPPRQHRGRGALLGVYDAVRDYFRECFTHRFYWYFFLMNTLFAVSWAAGNLFATLRNTGSLELSLKDLGRMAAVLAPISLALMYPAGWLADKLHPVRVYFYLTFCTVLSQAAQLVFLFGNYAPSTNLAIMYGVSIFFMPFSALQGAAEMPMYMRLLPKDRYGQFCSANGALRSFSLIFALWAAGAASSWLGSRTVDSYSAATAMIETRAAVGAAAGWQEEAVGPWDVAYRNHDARAGTVTVPGATQVKLWFEEIRTEHGRDFLTTDAATPDEWSGNFDAAWSGAKSGDTIRLRLTSSMARPGSFRLARVAWMGTKTGAVARGGALWEPPRDDAFALGGHCTAQVLEEIPFAWYNPATWFGGMRPRKGSATGVTVSFAAADGGPAPAPVVTDGSGNWAQNGFARGRDYRVAASKEALGGAWSFAAPTNAFGEARSDIELAGSFEEAAGWTEEEVGPWSVRYQNGWDRSGTIAVPGAEAVKLFFSVFKTEAGVDRLTVDGDGDAALSGRLGGFWSDAQTGDRMRLRLTTGLYGPQASKMTPRRSGSLHNDYEIRVTRVKYRGAKTGAVTREGAIWESDRARAYPLSGQVTDGRGLPVPGVTVAFRTVEGPAAAPPAVVTDARGNWCQVGFARGSRFAPVFSKEGDGAWSFSQPTIGDWRYRWYPVWALFFQVFAVTCLVLLYREWKRRGGVAGYSPPAA